MGKGLAYRALERRRVYPEDTLPVDILEILGAETRVVPTVPYADDMNYQKQAHRYAQSRDAALWVNQFDNIANRLAHFESTGPEIWAQTGGNIDTDVLATVLEGGTPHV